MSASELPDLVYGWPSVAAFLDISVRRARELVTARGLVSHRRTGDGAVGVARGDLEALAAEGGYSVPGKVFTSFHDDAARVPASSEPRPREPTRTEDAGGTLADGATNLLYSEELDLRLARVETYLDELANHDQNREATAADIGRLGGRIANSEKRHQSQDQTIAAIKRNANEDRQFAYALQVQLDELKLHFANLTALLRTMPMAVAPTGHKCGACGAKALASPVACGACGFGVGPGPTLG